MYHLYNADPKKACIHLLVFSLGQQSVSNSLFNPSELKQLKKQFVLTIKHRTRTEVQSKYKMKYSNNTNLNISFIHALTIFST